MQVYIMDPDLSAAKKELQVNHAAFSPYAIFTGDERYKTDYHLRTHIDF